jgi:WD40 repeat protein
MALTLGQLIYTSFARVGFQTLTSAEVPLEVRQIFIEQIVYQYWDSYNPPLTDYRAVYLHQISSDRILFGWLYNDGADDLGRSHVPYFICYYFGGAFDLQTILTYLSKGPIQMFDRQTLPRSIDRILLDDDYSAVRSGVMLQSLKNWGSEKLFKLFVEEPKQQLILEALITPEVLTTVTGGGQTAPRSPGVEAYQQMLLTQIPPKSLTLKRTLLMGTIPIGLCLIFITFSKIYIPKPLPTAQTAIAVLPSKSLTGHANSVWSVLLSSDGKTLISGSADHTIKIWHLESGQVLQTLSGHTDTVRSLTLTSNGKTLISGSGDRTLKIWNLQTHQVIQTLEQTSPIWSVSVSQDGKTLVSGSEDGTLNVWDLPTGTRLHHIPAHSNRIFSVAISPDGSAIATAGLDQTIKIWHLETGQLLRTITGHTAAVRALSFSPDGKTLVSGSWDTTLKLWNWQTGEFLRTLTGHTARVVTVGFTNDGQTLVSGSTDRTIRVWSTQTGQSIRTLSEHHDWILAIALNANLLVSGSKDQTIRIWQMK